MEAIRHKSNASAETDTKFKIEISTGTLLTKYMVEGREIILNSCWSKMNVKANKFPIKIPMIEMNKP